PAPDAGRAADAAVDAAVEDADAAIVEDAGSLDADVCAVECVHAWTALDDFPNLFRQWQEGAIAFDEATQQIVAFDAYDNRVFLFETSWRELVTSGEPPPPIQIACMLSVGDRRVALFDDFGGVWLLDIGTA